MTERLEPAETVTPDVSATAAAFGVALHTAGLPVGPDRCERLARAMTVMNTSSLADFRACALATMVSSPSQLPTFDRVFTAIFGDRSPFGVQLPGVPSLSPGPSADDSPAPGGSSAAEPGRLESGRQFAEAGLRSGEDRDDLPEGQGLRQLASAAEQLRSRDFTELSPAELGELYPEGVLESLGGHIVSLDALSLELREVRRQRFAINIEESEQGIAAVGVALRHRSGQPVGALSVSVPTIRFRQERVGGLVDALHAVAKELEAKI